MQNEQEIESAGHFLLFSLDSMFTCHEPHRWYNETLSNYSAAIKWGRRSKTALIAKIPLHGKSLLTTCRSARSSSVNTKHPQGYHISWSESLMIALSKQLFLYFQMCCACWPGLFHLNQLRTLTTSSPSQFLTSLFGVTRKEQMTPKSKC